MYKRQDLVGRLRQISGMTSITLSTNTAKTNVIMGDTIRLLWGQEFITDYLGEIKYQISPLSFYQVNPVPVSYTHLDMQPLWLQQGLL